MTKTEARQLTRAISDEMQKLNRSLESVSTLLHRAHEEKAWVPLGHSGWEDYVVSQFGISRQYAYQLIQNAKRMQDDQDHPKPLNLTAERGVRPQPSLTPLEAKMVNTLKAIERVVNTTSKLSEEKDDLSMDVQVAIIKAQVALRQLARLLKDDEEGAQST